MKQHNVQGIGKKKFKPVTTTSNQDLPIAETVFKIENVSEVVTKPNQFWGGDLTYVATEEGWLYLSIFLDLFTRKVVGHCMRSTMHADIVTNAIDMALRRQGIISADELTAHSDRGSQYASDAFGKKLAAHKITARSPRGLRLFDSP